MNNSLFLFKASLDYLKTMLRIIVMPNPKKEATQKKENRFLSSPAFRTVLYS
jgi:hypothetical protein